MADLHEYTTKEVLNKVLLDSSGNAVAAYSHTSQEALNAVLDSANSRLNVSLVGGTISGDVTISGDLVVQGGGSLSYDETISGTLGATRVNIGTRDASDNPPTDNASYLLQLEKYGGTANIKLSRTGNASSEYSNNHNSAHIGTITEHQFALRTHATDRLTITSAGDVQITSSSSSDSKPLFQFINTDTSNNYGGELQFYKNAAAGSDNDQLGKIVFYGNNDAGTPEKTNFASIFAYSDDVSDGTEDVWLRIRTIVGGTNTDTLTMRSGNVGIGTVSPSGAKLHIGQSADSEGLKITGFDDRNDKHANLYITSGGDFDITASGHIQINGGGNLYLYDYVLVQNRITKTGDGTLQFGGTYDVDMHFLGTGDAVVMAIDNGTKRVGIGTDSPGEKLEIYGNGADTTVKIHEDAGTHKAQLHLRSGGNDVKLYIDSTSFYLTREDALLFKLDASSRISLSNNDSGTSNTVFGKSIGTIDAGTNYNTFIGEGIIGAGGISDATENTALGWYSLRSLTTGDINVSIGSTAMEKNTTGGGNVGIGVMGLRYNVTGTNNTAIGTHSQKGVSGNSHSNNTSVGYQSLLSITTGSANVALGSGAGSAMLGSTDSIAIGKDSLNAIAGNTTTDTNNMGFRNIGIGTDALGSLNGTHVSALSNDNIAIGFQSGLAGSRGSAIPFSGNIAIGNYALDATAGTSQTGNIAIGYEALTLQDTATVVGIGDVNNPNIAIGYQAGKRITSGDSNVIIGHLSHGKAAADGRGDDNVYIGARSAYTAADADSNIAIGRDSLYSTVAGAFNIAIGHSALYTANHTSNDGTVAIGYEACKIQAGASGAQFASSTIGIGYKALTALTTGTANTAIGYEALKGIEDDVNNTALGYQALSGSTGTSESNTAIGAGSMVGNIAGAAHNTAVGYNTLAAVTSGDNNIAIGNNAGAAATTTSENIFIGKNAGTAVQTDAKVVAIGYNAYMTNDTTNGHDSTATNGSGNTAIGYKSMTGFNDVNCLRNTAIGFDTMSQGTSHNPQDNVAVGYKSLRSINDGDRNTAIGSNALLDIVTGSGSTAVGHDALENTTASECVGVGKGAGQTNTSGINNTFVGTDADSSGNFNYQTAVGWGATTEGSNQTVIGVGSIWKMFSAEVTCNLGGTDENDPAHATPIGKIPHNACVVKAAVVMKTKNGTSGKNDHSLKLVLSSSSSGTDNTVLADVQELVGAGMTHSWNGAAATSQAADIDCSNNTGQNGTAYVSMALPNSRGSDDPATQLASLDMRDGDRFIYLAFANGSHTDGDTNPASAPVCQVYVEYVGLQL